MFIDLLIHVKIILGRSEEEHARFRKRPYAELKHELLLVRTSRSFFHEDHLELVDVSLELLEGLILILSQLVFNRREVVLKECLGFCGGSSFILYSKLVVLLLEFILKILEELCRVISNAG